MKKVISLLITVAIMMSSLSVVFAAEVPTLTVGSVDASSVAVGEDVVIPVTIDKLPEGSVGIVELKVTFDNTKLAFQYADCWDGDEGYAMQVYDTSNRNEAKWGLDDPTWQSPEGDALDNANAAGEATVLYSDSTKKITFTTNESLADNTTLLYLWFTKLEGATGTDTVDFSYAYMRDYASNSSGNDYWKSAEAIKTVPGTVTFTAGPKDKVETVGTTYTGDLGEVVDGDTSDVATAIYAELNGDTDTTYKKVNWTVNATIDEKAVVGTYTSDVNLSGEATYYLGMVIQGLAQDTVTAVAAALAE